MIRLVKFFSGVFAIVLLPASLAAFGHQQKSAVTVIVYNEAKKNLEISHRFYIHDAEHAVLTLLSKDADLLASTNTQQQFGAYVESQFGLRVDTQTALQAKYVGHEIIGKFFWVHQELAMPSIPRQLEIFHGSLQSLWPSQTNLVNIEGFGPIQSLRFNAKTGWQTVPLGTQ